MDRNNARMQFFNSRVRPKIRDPRNTQATFDDFMRRTERPWTDRAGDIGEQIGGKIGEFIIQGAEIAALTAVAGPLTGGLAKTLMGAGPAANIVGKIASGGLAFGAYDALKAKEGDRVAAGLKGAAFGAVTELGIGAVFGWSEKEATKALDDAEKSKTAAETPINVPGRPDLPTMGHVAAEVKAAEVKAAKAHGITTGPAIATPGTGGLRVVVKDAEGKPTVHTVTRANREDILAKVDAALQNGGEIGNVFYHPNSQARMVEFMRHYADKAEAEEQTFRMKVPEGRSGEVAKELNRLGLGGRVVDDTTIAVGPEAPWLKSQRARELAKAATRGPTVPEQQLPDDISKTMMEAGRVRNEINLTESPDPVHRRLHSLLGDAATDYGITREQAGQLALRYFERNIGKVEPESATKILNDYKGRGERFGAVIGERPPEGYDIESRLPGFRQALPGAEAHEIDVDELTGQLRTRPVGTTKWLDLPSEELGFGGAQIRTPEGPVRILAADATEKQIVHENLHDGFSHADLDKQVPRLMKGHEETANGIIEGLRGASPAYRGFSRSAMANEALAAAGTAIRLGDRAALEELAGWDTSEDHVKAFVNTVAGRTYTETLGMEQTAPIRAFQRRLTDLVRRTSADVAQALADGQMMGYTTWYDPEIAGWVMRDGEGRDIIHNNIEDVWNHLHRADVSDLSPDMAHDAYFSGNPGSLAPSGMEPIQGSATPEPLDIPMGLGTFATLTAPAMDYAARLEEDLVKQGSAIRPYLPWRQLEMTARDAKLAMDRQQVERNRIIQGLSAGQRQAIGELLSRPETDWSAMSTAYKISDSDLANARLLSELDETHLQGGLKRTLKTIRQVRERSGNLSGIGGDPWVRDAIEKSHLGHSNLDVGYISQAVMRNGYNEAIAEDLQAFRDIQKQFPRKSPTWQNMQNYQNHILDIPDASQHYLDETMKRWEVAANARRLEINKKLGIQIPEINLKGAWGAVRNLMFVGGLGERLAPAVRDTFWGTMGMINIGPTAWAKGFARTMTKEGRAEADAAGALFHRGTAGQFWGDAALGEVPTGRAYEFINRWTDRMLAPNRIGHNIGRAATYLGEKDQALEQIAQLRAGKITSAELMDNTGAWFARSPERARLTGIANDSTIPLEEAARQFGLSATEQVQFGGTPGQILRTGMGRMLGQYATWPMNHIEFTRKLVRGALDNKKKGVPALALWAALNYGAFEGMKSLGIDVSKWLFVSPAGWTGSPSLELVQNALKAPEESPAGLKARHDILTFPLSMFPGGVEMADVYRAWNKGDLSVAALAGFRPYKEATTDEDLESEFIREIGLNPKTFE